MTNEYWLAVFLAFLRIPVIHLRSTPRRGKPCHCAADAKELRRRSNKRAVLLALQECCASIPCKFTPLSFFFFLKKRKPKHSPPHIMQHMAALPCASLSALSLAISNFLTSKEKKAKRRHFSPLFSSPYIKFEADICRCLLCNCSPPILKLVSIYPPPLAAWLQSISAAGFKLRYVALPVCFEITRQLLIFLGGGRYFKACGM